MYITVKFYTEFDAEGKVVLKSVEPLDTTMRPELAMEFSESLYKEYITGLAATHGVAQALRGNTFNAPK